METTSSSLGDIPEASELEHEAQRVSLSSSWSSLPTELLERVLAFLPFPHLFRLRAVCKRWNSLPYCPLFRQTMVNGTRNSWGPCLPVLFCNHSTPTDEETGKEEWKSDSWCAFDTVSRQWVCLPPLSCFDSRNPKFLVVGAGGLLCIGDFNITENLMVCNPMTRWSKELPSMNQVWISPDLTSMAIDRQTGGYKILLAGNRMFNPEENGYNTTEIYDSLVGSWAVVSDFPPYLELCSQEGALCDNILYCTAWNSLHTHLSENHCSWDTLVAYDFQRDAWSIVPQTFPRDIIRTPHLVSSCNSVFMVAEYACLQPNLNDETGVCIFKYTSDTRKWNMITLLPHDMYMGIGKRVVTCTAEGALICLTGCTENRWYSAMYNLNKSIWEQIPNFSLAGTDGEQCEILLSSSPFHPSLDLV